MKKYIYYGFILTSQSRGHWGVTDPKYHWNDFKTTSYKKAIETINTIIKKENK